MDGYKVWGTLNLIAVNLWYLTSVQPTFPTSLSADSESLEEEAPSLRRVSSQIARCQTVRLSSLDYSLLPKCSPHHLSHTGGNEGTLGLSVK